jgi:glycerol uptake facilitator-like aquaporin
MSSHGTIIFYLFLICIFFCQQAQPAMTVSMLTLGKCDYTEAFVRIAGAMGGGLVSFPLFYAIADIMALTPFGGPQFSQKAGEDHPVEAALSEFVATFLLCWAIYLVSVFWEGEISYTQKKHK